MYGNDQYTKLLIPGRGVNNSTNIVDTSRNPRKTIENVGASISTTQYKFGSTSLKVNSSDAGAKYIKVPQLGDFSFGSGNFTVECWFYMPGSFFYILPFAVLPEAGSGSWFKLALHPQSGGQIWSYIGTGGSGVYNPGVTYDTWYHLAWVRSGNSVYHFINGTNKGTWTYTGTFTASDYLTVGWSSGNDGENTDYYIDEFRVSDTARYTSDFSSPTSAFTVDANTKLLLHFEGADGSTTYVDESNTTRINKTITVNGNTVISTAQSKFSCYGSSIYFDGIGDYLTIGSNFKSTDHTQSFTYDFWYYPKDTTAYHAWLTHAPSKASGACYFYSTNLGVFYDGSHGYYLSGLTIHSSWNANTWNHIAWVYQGHTGNTLVFLNGTKLVDSGLSYGSMGTFEVRTIGYSDDYVAKGYMSNIRFSDGIARWTSTFTPPARPYGFQGLF